MLDQAEGLRKIAFRNKLYDAENTHKKHTKIITVTSGKGGVGKSNFVVNLAIALRKKGKRVMIFDSDIGMGNDDVLMGVFPKYNIYDVLFNNMKVEDVIVEGIEGVKLLSGGRWIDRIDKIDDEKRDLFIKNLTKLEDLDYMIIDTGAGVSKTILSVISCSEDTIVVTTPEPTSLTDAYSLLKAVDHFKIKSNFKLVVNKVLNAREAIQSYNKFNNTVNKFLKIRLDYLGKMSEDRKLIESVRSQKPFVLRFPKSDVAKDLFYMANKIIGSDTEEKVIGVEKFFKGLFKFFS